MFELEAHRFEHQLARLDARDVEHVVDQGQQRLGGQLDLVQVAALALGQRRVLQQARQADDGVHGSADLVAHVGHERALGPAGRLGFVARQPQVLVQLLQVQFRLLQFRHVRLEHEEAAHPVLRVVIGNEVDPGVADGAGRPGQPALEALRPAAQGVGHMGRAQGIAGAVEHFRHAGADDLPGVAAVPFEEVAVGEAALQVGVPVGHHAGQVVRHGAQELFALGQPFGRGMEHGLGLAALRDVERDAQQVGHVAALVAQRHLARGQVVGRAAVGRHQFLFHFAHLARGQRAPVVGAEGLGLGRRHDVVVGLTQHVGPLQAQQRLAVAVEHLIAQVGGPLDKDGGRHVLDHGLEHLARLAQRRFRAFQFADVEQQAGDAGDGAVGVELRVVADDPVAGAPGRGRAHAGAFYAHQRLAGLEHGAVVVQYAAPHLRVADHGRQRLAQVGRHGPGVVGGQVVVDAHHAQFRVHITEAHGCGGVQRFELGPFPFQLGGALGHQGRQLVAVALQVGLQRTQGLRHGLGFAERHAFERERGAAGQRLGRLEQGPHGVADAPAHHPGQREAGRQQQRQRQRHRADGGQQFVVGQGARRGHGHREAAGRGPVQAQVDRGAVGRLGIEQRFVAQAQLDSQRGRRQLAHHVAAAAVVGHQHAVAVIQGHAVAARHLFVEQGAGQPVRLEQHRQRVARLAVVTHRHVDGQQGCIVVVDDGHGGVGRGVVGQQGPQAGRVAARAEGAGHRLVGRRQQFAAIIAEQETGAGELGHEQAGGLFAEAGQVAALQAGRGGQGLGRAGALGQVAVDGGGHDARQLARIVAQGRMFAAVELAHEGGETDYGGQRAGQYQQRDLRAYRRQGWTGLVWQCVDPK